MRASRVQPRLALSAAFARCRVGASAQLLAAKLYFAGKPGAGKFGGERLAPPAQERGKILGNWAWAKCTSL